MTQNIYDDPDFLAGYSRLDRSVYGLDGALEWPTLQAMLPPLDGLRVLDLGCGFGWFCRWAVDNGAQSVVGLDVSERMLLRAVAETKSDVIEYRRHDLEQLGTAELGDFDLVYSSLTLHYLSGLASVYSQVHNVLPPGGRFVFSVEHPIFSSPTVQEFRECENGARIWPLDKYLIEGQRSTNWLVDGVLKQHRTIATYLNELIAAGFVLERIVEFGPSEDQMTDPRWIDEQHRPQFLLVSAQRA
jgi:SAM-dependent methyltransferase